MAPKRPDEIAHLTGRLAGSVRPPSISLPAGGGKFTTDGCVQIWPGNTFICHIDRTSDAYRHILELQEEVKQSRFSQFFTFLPPSSFHMTVFEGISPVSVPGNGWPDGVPTGASRDAVSRVLLERVEPLVLPRSYRIKIDGFFAGHSLTVSGADEAEEQALRQTRRTLSEATGIAFEAFDDYVFHITLAYLVEWLSEKTARELAAFGAEAGRRFRERVATIELGAVEFCDFDSMHHFEPIRTEWTGSARQAPPA